LDVWELMGAGEAFGDEEEMDYEPDQGYLDDAGES